MRACKAHINQERAHWPRKEKDLATGEKKLEEEKLFFFSLTALVIEKHRRILCLTTTCPCLDMEMS